MLLPAMFHPSPPYTPCQLPCVVVSVVTNCAAAGTVEVADHRLDEALANNKK
jgi:hypothetical protein